MRIAVIGSAAESYCRSLYNNTENRKKLLDRYPKSFFGLYSRETGDAEAPLFAVDFESAEEGGVFAALWRLLKRNGLGGSFSQRAIPVTQAAIEICETFGLDPYRCPSKGCFVLLLREDRDDVTVIGHTAKGAAIVRTDGETISYLRRPEGSKQ